MLLLLPPLQLLLMSLLLLLLVTTAIHASYRECICCTKKVAAAQRLEFSCCPTISILIQAEIEVGCCPGDASSASAAYILLLLLHDSCCCIYMMLLLILAVAAVQVWFMQAMEGKGCFQVGLSYCCYHFSVVYIHTGKVMSSLDETLKKWTTDINMRASGLLESMNVSFLCRIKCVKLHHQLLRQVPQN
ncbi:uncharacterized protein LOC122085441 [Macadamia integrifolia]|uniref:uncharacterized protein LOC122085441 n=1 Tax=Macadamia integrifolia TaxID=60698 RepID=UPI001C4F0FDD|nr:uncharacterized protein LOC122085441 [Macadamia integrifolia]